MARLSIGQEVCVRFEDEWHSRLVVGFVDEGLYVIATPQGHVYLEDHRDQGDVDEVRLRPDNRALPVGIFELASEFDPFPSANQLMLLMREGQALAREE
eukprot:1243388-Karenia_brevis.AAC.1